MCLNSHWTIETRFLLFLLVIPLSTTRTVCSVIVNWLPVFSIYQDYGLAKLLNAFPFTPSLFQAWAPSTSIRDLIQFNYQTRRFLFPLQNLSVCNRRICSVLVQLPGLAHDLHIHTQLNATLDWTLHMWGFCAHENCSGVMQSMMAPGKRPDIQTPDRKAGVLLQEFCVWKG